MPQAGLQQRGGQSSLAAPSLLLPGDARGVGFTPASLPGLVLWLDAGSIGQADNTSVARWPDLSGLGNDAVQGTVAAQPTYFAAGLNGRPAVQGDGTDDVMLLGVGSLPSGWYVALALSGAGAATNAGLIGKWGAGATFPEWAVGRSGVTTQEALGGGNGGNFKAANSGAGGDNLPHIIQGWWDGATLACQVDGTTVTTPLAAYATNAAATTLFAGATGSAWSPMALGTAIVCAAAPSAGQRARVRAYLGARYGIAVTP